MVALVLSRAPKQNSQLISVIANGKGKYKINAPIFHSTVIMVEIRSRKSLFLAFLYQTIEKNVSGEILETNTPKVHQHIQNWGAEGDAKNMSPGLLKQ